MSLQRNNLMSYDLAMQCNVTNTMCIPAIDKVIVSISHPSVTTNKRNILPILIALELITGQKPQIIQSRKPIPQFNVREGAILGAKVTLRTKKMLQFTEKMASAVLPKIQNFEGFRESMVGQNGNFTFKLKDPLVFTELEQEYEKFTSLPSIQITYQSKLQKCIVDKNKNLSYLNHPFVS